jgi:hypothetical protein
MRRRSAASLGCLLRDSLAKKTYSTLEDETLQKRVIPAQAGIHFATVKNQWIPAQLPK